MATFTAIARGLRQQSVGLKVLMAVSGLLLVGWSALHLMGNLLVFGDAASMDGYATALRASGIVWPVRALLTLALVVHVAAAIQLVRRSPRAGPSRYRYRRPTPPSASRWMRAGGMGLGLFLLYHLAHIYGPLHGSYVEGAVHHNLVAGLREPLAAALYAIAAVLFGAHVAHGASSAIVSLGAALGSRARAASVLVGTTLAVGFLAPIAYVWLTPR